MKSRQPKSYRWQTGDWITATEAAELLGYKSSKNLRDKERLKKLQIEFELLDCVLTVGLEVGGQKRFLRSEFDEFLTAKVEAKQQENKKRQSGLRLAA